VRPEQRDRDATASVRSDHRGAGSRKWVMAQSGARLAGAAAKIRCALYRIYVLLAEPPIEPISGGIPDQVPLGKAQRIGGRANESPALPLSYSAAASDSIPPHVPPAKGRPVCASPAPRGPQAGWVRSPDPQDSTRGCAARRRGSPRIAGIRLDALYRAVADFVRVLNVVLKRSRVPKRAAPGPRRRDPI
jgi:hypothetical protein